MAEYLISLLGVAMACITIVSLSVLVIFRHELKQALAYRGLVNVRVGNQQSPQSTVYVKGENAYVHLTKEGGDSIAYGKRQSVISSYSSFDISKYFTDISADNFDYSLSGLADSKSLVGAEFLNPMQYPKNVLPLFAPRDGERVNRVPPERTQQVLYEGEVA